MVRKALLPLLAFVVLGCSAFFTENKIIAPSKKETQARPIIEDILARLQGQKKKHVQICVEAPTKRQREFLVKEAKLALVSWMRVFQDQGERFFNAVHFSSQATCPHSPHINDLLITLARSNGLTNPDFPRDSFNRPTITCIRSDNHPCTPNLINASVLIARTGRWTNRLILSPFVAWKPLGVPGGASYPELIESASALQNEKRMSPGDRSFQTLQGIFISASNQSASTHITYTAEMSSFPYLLESMGVVLGLQPSQPGPSDHTLPRKLYLDSKAIEIARGSSAFRLFDTGRFASHLSH